MDSAVPYQAYRSKRHSRSISTSPADTQEQQPAANVNDVGTADGNEHPIDAPNGHDVTPPKRRAVSVSLTPPSPPVTNGHAGPSTAPSSPTASSSKQTLTSPPTAKPPSSATSTFRHVPPRIASQPHAPSPLRPNYLPKPSSQSLTVSPSFSRQSSIHRFDAPQRPAIPRELRSRVSSTASSPGRVTSPTPAAVLAVEVTPSPAKIHSPRPSSSISEISPPPSKPQSPSPAPPLSSPRRPAAPYRPGFQPKGVYRPRTDEFISARSAVRDRGKVEQRRLERRLEKLIALHFPPASNEALDTEKVKTPPANRRSSSIFDFDFSKNPSELWREVVESRIQGPKADTRAEEQNITPWEDDAAVSQCPLCATSFHPLTNRKHHCRLCGRIVCSLPPRPPTRTQTCSLLFVVDQRTGRIEEVGEGVDYGVKKLGEEEDKFLKGVRICRDCRTALLRQQYVQEAKRVPTFARLYAALTAIEKEIEDTLPQFQELMLTLSTNDTNGTPAHAADTRKRLLASFTEYDRVAKRIHAQPALRGSSQERVQAAILSRANLFLQKNMFPLQSLPKPQPSTGSETPAAAVDVDAELAHALQPLLEQEALLESFVEEARAQRKFEDARTLKANLEEIRAEIERVAHRGNNAATR